MEWYERFKPRLAEIYEEAKLQISSFPLPLNEIGLRYAEKFDPVSPDDNKDYICTLLPYWLREATGLSEETCDRLALANVFGMLYFFIQDDVMDRNVAGAHKEKLALGNLLYMRMFRIFRSLFPSDSAFWERYDRYVTVWADCVVNEQRRNFYIHDPILTAGKAAPVKVSIAGACLLTGREERLAAAEQAVDLALMTLQMLDDWFDWRQDLEEGNYNGLLAIIAAAAAPEANASNDGNRAIALEHGDFARPGAAAWRAPSLEQAESAIYVRGCLKEFVHAAERNHTRLLALPHGMSDLVRFHRHMADSLRRIAEELDANKRRLLGGGINLWLGRTGSKS